MSDTPANIKNDIIHSDENHLSDQSETVDKIFIHHSPPSLINHSHGEEAIK